MWVLEMISIKCSETLFRDTLTKLNGNDTYHHIFVLSHNESLMCPEMSEQLISAII